MTEKQTKNSGPISKWLVVALALTAFVVAVMLAGIITFTIGGATVTKEEYASAAIVCICLGLSCLVLGLGTWGRKVALLPMLVAPVLVFLGASSVAMIEEGSDFSVIYDVDSGAITWLVLSIFVSAPLCIIAFREIFRQKSIWRLVSAAIICSVTPILLLFALAIPVHAETARDFADYQRESEENRKRSVIQDEEFKAAEAKSREINNGLDETAKNIVRSVVSYVRANNKLPVNIESPAGYEVTEYVIENKYQAKFCITPIDQDGYYLGTTVNTAANSDTEVWLAYPSGGETCTYGYDRSYTIKR